MTGKFTRFTLPATALISAFGLGLVGFSLGFEMQTFSSTQGAKHLYRSVADFDLLQGAVGALVGGVIGWFLGGLIERVAILGRGERGRHIAGLVMGALAGLLMGLLVAAAAGARTEITIRENGQSMERDVDLAVLIVGAVFGTLIGALAAQGILLTGSNHKHSVPT
jgi:hypothetical protein